MNSSVFARTAQALSSEFYDGEDDEHDSSDEREGLYVYIYIYIYI